METKFVVICLKTLLLTYSFAFWVTGVILLAFGVWGKLNLGIYLSLIARHYADIPSVLIVTGTMIVSFGLFGCVAACLGNPYMLKLYSLFLSLIFLVELLVSISGLLFHRGIKASFLNIYTNAVQNYNGNDDKSQAVDQVQYSLICCGVKNYTDWKTSPYFMDHGIPRSCCKDESDCNSQDLHNLTVAATKVNQRGCYGLMMSFLEANMGTIIGVLFVVTFSQVIGLRLSCCLSRFIVAHQREMV
ncbi:tetraspanin-7-like [Cricetulus griseus]|uniref:Tetraspanin n=1 Tax=Cricetulus griseus TaxID=10029 RepID=A0A9J7GS84_CRIGR|nr:tetraspanin-7-like [Cricetulus griseus]XP_035312894.1 tetraspanin-7-like [Cricetulus griseus]